MSEFEKWFKDQDFYTSMRFIHGDKLFDKDGDVYRVLPVQMTYQGWSSQRQRSKDEFVELTQEWHTKGWNARQGEIDDLKAEIEKIESDVEIIVSNMGSVIEKKQAIIDEHTEVIKLQDADLRKYEKQIESLKAQLAVYKEDMAKDAEKIVELTNKIEKPCRWCGFENKRGAND